MKDSHAAQGKEQAIVGYRRLSTSGSAGVQQAGKQASQTAQQASQATQQAARSVQSGGKGAASAAYRNLPQQVRTPLACHPYSQRNPTLKSTIGSITVN